MSPLKIHDDESTDDSAVSFCINERRLLKYYLRFICDNKPTENISNYMHQKNLFQRADSACSNVRNVK